MTAGRPGGGDNLWRDVAAGVLSDLSETLRKARAQVEQGQRPSYDATPDDDSLKAEGHTRWHNQNPLHRTTSSTASDVGRDLKDLVSSSLRVTQESVTKFQSDRDQRRQRGPIRRARTSAAVRYVGAGLMGLFALSGASVAGVVLSDAELTIQSEDEAPTVQDVPDAVAILPGALAIGGGVGAFVLTRSGRRFSKRAEELENALTASSVSTARFTGPSPASAPLPPKDSAAYEPLRQLFGQRQALAELLPEVQAVAPDLAPLAAESEQALFGVAERITLLERARDAGAGGPSEAGINAGLQRLVGQLIEGVQSHQKLVDAAATVLAELSTTEVPGPHRHHDLGEAANRLDALAAGLREVRSDVHLDNPSFIDGPPPAQNNQPQGSAAPAPRAGTRRSRARGRTTEHGQ